MFPRIVPKVDSSLIVIDAHKTSEGHCRLSGVTRECGETDRFVCKVKDNIFGKTQKRVIKSNKTRNGETVWSLSSLGPWRIWSYAIIMSVGEGSSRIKNLNWS